jgi:hypothetical protein
MDYKTARKTVRRYAARMLVEEAGEILLVGVGSKDAGPLCDVKEFSVTAFVKNKHTKKELRSRGVEPFDKLFERTVAGPPPARTDIDVVECGSAFEPLLPAPRRGLYGGNPPVLNAQKWFSTLRSGIGITNPTGNYPRGLSVGTLGFFVEGGSKRYLVSNNHVIGRSNEAKAGESVVQPGTLDLTGLELQLMSSSSKLKSRTEIATVEAVVPLQFRDEDNTPTNRVDAAMAGLTSSGRELTELARLTFGGGIRGVAPAYRVDATGSVQGSARVYKVGRTTGYTEGRVVALAGTAFVPYPGGEAFFGDQIVVQATDDNVGPFSDRGDSGSGVLNDRHELVGLLFAGSEQQTLVNPIAHVLAKLREASGIADLSVVTL